MHIYSKIKIFPIVFSILFEIKINTIHLIPI